jgi:hypothetical protein
MGLLDYFRGKPLIRDMAAIATFVDENAAFLMQKGIYEFARARAGHYAKVLFGEPEFQRAVEVSRWRAYPLGLAIITETVVGVLRERIRDKDILPVLRERVLAAFDGYPVPAALGADEWLTLRSELARQLQLIGLHPPKRVIDIPEQWAQRYFDLMPIHEKLRGRDFATTRNYLRAQLCNIHQEFVDRLDSAAVSAGFEHAGVT